MPHPRAVWLIRHGQTDWNLERRYMSFSDRALTPFGERQAAALAAFLAVRKIDAIVHTGLARTERMALAIAGERTVEFACDPRWREASHGAWEGLTYRDVMQRYPDDARKRFADPVGHAPLSGESLAAMAVRVGEAWRDLGTRFAGRRVAVVTHGGPIQALLCALFAARLAEHWRWRIDLGGATSVDCYPSTTIVRAVNVVPPLARGTS